jgi:hypothetical protein
MHVVVFFSLIILSFVRLIGVGISIDFYSRTKNSKYINLGISWALWLLSGLFPLITLIVINPFLSNILLVLNILFTTIAITLIVKELLVYFIEFKNKYLIIIVLIIIFLCILFYFTSGAEIAIGITSVIYQTIWILGILYPFIKWRKFTERVNKQLWYQYFLFGIVSLLYIPISIYIFIEGLRFGLYEAENVILIILNYGYIFIITFFIQMLTVHLEFTLSNIQKDKLKDMYSHNLGNALQAIYMSVDLFLNPEINNTDAQEIKNSLQVKLSEAAELLKEIRDL